jgi:hypothetical protein
VHTISAESWASTLNNLAVQIPWFGYYFMDENQKKIYDYRKNQTQAEQALNPLMGIGVPESREKYAKATSPHKIRHAMSFLTAAHNIEEFQKTPFYKQLPNISRIKKEIAIREVALKDVETPNRDRIDKERDHNNILRPLGVNYDQVEKYKQEVSKRVGTNAGRQVAHIKLNIQRYKAYIPDLEKKLRTYRAVEK